jgi:proline iminopeptidase
MSPHVLKIPWSRPGAAGIVAAANTGSQGRVIVAPKVQEGFAPVAGGELYYREVGQGQAMAVIHGGPDFNHAYLLPDLDRLSSGYRLVYYDQRGRGRWRGRLNLDDIHIDTYVADLEGLRRHLGLESMAVMGHSWGAIVALHYALRYPERTSHIVLMNAAPASHDDMLRMRTQRLRRHSMHQARLTALMPGYARGDPDAVADYYRIDFGTTFRRVEDVQRLDLNWSREESQSGRAIEKHLAQGLIWSEGYSLLPALAAVRAPTLVIHGDYDFIPIECAEHIVEAIPGARLAVIPDSGHFSYIDAPDPTRHALDRFFAAHLGATATTAPAHRVT